MVLAVSEYPLISVEPASGWAMASAAIMAMRAIGLFMLIA